MLSSNRATYPSSTSISYCPGRLFHTSSFLPIFSKHFISLKNKDIIKKKTFRVSHSQSTHLSCISFLSYYDTLVLILYTFFSVETHSHLLPSLRTSSQDCPLPPVTSNFPSTVSFPLVYEQAVNSSHLKKS